MVLGVRTLSTLVPLICNWGNFVICSLFFLCILENQLPSFLFARWWLEKENHGLNLNWKHAFASFYSHSAFLVLLKKIIPSLVLINLWHYRQKEASLRFEPITSRLIGRVLATQLMPLGHLSAIFTLHPFLLVYFGQLCTLLWVWSTNNLFSWIFYLKLFSATKRSQVFLIQTIQNIIWNKNNYRQFFEMSVKWKWTNKVGMDEQSRTDGSFFWNLLLDFIFGCNTTLFCYCTQRLFENWSHVLVPYLCGSLMWMSLLLRLPSSEVCPKREVCRKRKAPEKEDCSSNSGSQMSLLWSLYSPVLSF